MIRNLYHGCLGGETGINPQVHISRFPLNSMLTITFGFRADIAHHSIVDQALRLSREFMNITGPVSNFVDFIPMLQKLPTDTWNRGCKLHSGLVDTYGGLIEKIDRNIQAGFEVQNCLVKTMLLEKEKEALNDIDMVLLASAFMIGGVDTVTEPSSVA